MRGVFWCRFRLSGNPAWLSAFPHAGGHQKIRFYKKQMDFVCVIEKGSV
ncbi:hypothetical protein HMPREF1985_01512 [Mitsuokella sp. oral taxon 131 str. W9106]|nr:hypothetical protein HMPREF1985_01512 [Mitsuokella sp. oral taxon 131 str. W9106]